MQYSISLYPGLLDRGNAGVEAESSHLHLDVSNAKFHVLQGGHLILPVKIFTI